MSTDTLFQLILGIIVVGYLIDTWLDVLNFRHSQAQEWNQDIFTKERHEKSLAYQREKFRLSTASSALSFIVSVCAIGFGLFGVLDDYVRNFSTNPIV